MKSVLIVEDNRTLHDLYKALIVSTYPELIVAYAFDGKEALDKIKKLEYCALISDIDMPGMDGIELYKSLKEENSALARKMVFITSGYDNPEYKSFINMEKIPFLAKPFNRKDFISCLDRVLCDKGDSQHNSGFPASPDAKH
ncbi:MAG: response regulator [Proteobacteria bacterium]|nr:response regulator [Pseudomonadota bacterium]